MTISNWKSLVSSFAMSATLFLTTVTMSASTITQANAQVLRCGVRSQMVKTLGSRFKENRFAMGLASNVQLLEVFISKKGTWTILSTRANGKTCIIAAGKSWVSMPEELEGDAVNY